MASAQEQSVLSQVELDDALVDATKNSSAELIERLFLQGARLNERSTRNAYLRDDITILEVMLKYGWDINDTSIGAPILMLAVDSDPKILRWLLEHGADTEVRRVIKRGQAISVNKRFTPLEYAAQVPETDALKFLLEYGAKLEPDILCYTMAIPRRGSDGKISRLPHMKILVEHGADVNGWSKQHGTPLHCAVHFYRREMLEYLLEKGADPTIRGHSARTPAEMAKRDGKLDLYRILCGEEDV